MICLDIIIVAMLDLSPYLMRIGRRRVANNSETDICKKAISKHGHCMFCLHSLHAPAEQ